ncbi:MAG: lysine biosynthesis protein LysX [Nitrososphaerota archaeon]|nr:lysine biosynthesis protein LysX [Nitrososphaerota archaeon]MDG6903920.1 lysine biosynthesis protein LysX [Nitrososphaerota archaeon]MDG6919167.1 lysine biosynthesis protein LysX [Nitrososphaerota archaeon]MDG6920571.1 lysine biosynthesis protein LysX [Nitrososphaerota archaeon]MDG6924844.1 lysine biosynthesis protein LysX [Nitrososphaerota archaeon]
MKLTITFDRLRWEEKALSEAAAAAGIDATLVDVKGLVFEVPKRRQEFGDVVLQRCISHYRSSNLTRALEGAGIQVVNSQAVAEVCSNKLATTIALSKAGVPTPRTFLALTSEAAEEAAEALGYPLVLKPFTGSWGRMVTVVRDRETLRSLIEYKEELANPQEQHMYYMQEYVNRPPRDVRAIVAGDSIVACVHRVAPPGEWRTNVARGATSEAFKPDADLTEVILKAAEAVGGGILGVDAMEPESGYLVHEVNNTVEFKGAQSAVGLDIPSRLIGYVAGLARR